MENEMSNLLDLSVSDSDAYLKHKELQNIRNQKVKNLGSVNL